MSGKIPKQHKIENGNVVVSVSFGLLTSFGKVDSTTYPYTTFRVAKKNGESVIIRKISTAEFEKPEYRVEEIWDENRQWIIDLIFTHTETIELPLSLFTSDSGLIFVSLIENTSDGKLGEGQSVKMRYTRTDNVIYFSKID